MKAFLSLLKSEHLEHRGGQLWTPLIIAAILLLLLVWGMFQQGSMLINVTVEDTRVDMTTVDDAVAAIRQKVGEDRASPVLQAISFGSAYAALLPGLVVAIIVSYFLMVGSMHNERADRSILFWKSMPVSDLKVTLAKFLSSTFGTLLIATAIGIAITLIGVLLHAIAGPLSSTPEWATVVHSSVIASLVLLTFSFCAFYVLWAAPVYGWILLASAWAPRSPLLYVAVPPVAIGVLEAMITREGSWLWREILSRAGGQMLNIDIPLGSEVHSVSSLSGILLNQIGRMAEGAASPRFWLGLLATVLFIWAASEIRRRRIA